MKKIIIFCICFILIVSGILLYSRYIGTKGLNINEYKITYSELSDDFYGLKIVHLSDIHYGRTVFEKELKELVNKINLTKPDIVVFTGDLIDKDIKISSKEEDKIAKILSNIEVSIGKYAIKGNHDKKNYEIIMENSDFKILNNDFDLIYTNSTNYILISGMSTNIKDKTTLDNKLKSTIDYLNSTQLKPNYSILLMHEPDFIDKFDYSNFNLILAGHSHNGQVRLPFIGAIIKPEHSKKYYDSYYKKNTTDLYISSGIGVSTVNFRLFNKPSFNLYRLTN